MIFGKSNKHPLPNFPSQVIPTFYSLCEELPEASIAELSTLVNEALSELREREKHVRFVDLDMAEAVTGGCLFLLGIYKERTGYERSLIIGAVRYYAISDDPFPDTMFATGLDDDAKVVNFVLEQLGIHDHYIRIE
jgi:hypothetical protein